MGLFNGSYLGVSAIFIFGMYRQYDINRVTYWFRELRALFFLRKLKTEETLILEKYFGYYRKLNQKHKSEFTRKLELILSTKEFVGRGGISEVSSEMEILIGATIVQVTFGWKRIRLPHFDKILIYPTSYYNTSLKSYHKGEVNPKLGVIVLSWKSFVEGLIDNSDGVNLGIHEIAHALQLENQIRFNGESDFLDKKQWSEYKILAARELESLRSGRTSLMRNRAGNDEDEFFAVALETFFEKPSEFKSEIPDLYQVLVNLLCQDPLVWMDQKS